MKVICMLTRNHSWYVNLHSKTSHVHFGLKKEFGTCYALRPANVPNLFLYPWDVEEALSVLPLSLSLLVRWAFLVVPGMRDKVAKRKLQNILCFESKLCARH